MLNPQLARIRSFEVVPSLPAKLQPLLKIAYNLWWSWHPEAIELFLRLDRKLWQESMHNPVRMLGSMDQTVLEQAAADEGFLNSLDRVLANLDRHMTRKPWLASAGHDVGDAVIAYFCAEFGLTECLQTYSGGLGCLAGDHLKSAAELGLPLVGVGLLYRHGYFQQYLNADGWQQEYYPDLDFANLPTQPVLDQNGKQITVEVELPGRSVTVAVWRTNVGRISLFLLDTNLNVNDEADRLITGQLYGGDMEMRIKQELILGIGGVRALEALGMHPTVCHMNEGHSAFLALERIRNLIAKYNLTFDEARQQAAASHVFTTHTPVPAGIDRFHSDMIQRYFRDYVGSLKLDMEGLLALGRENVYDRNEYFSMAVLAIRTSCWANGVSKLHGKISRQMWNGIWPRLPDEEVPITHVTNGIHARSWLSADLMYMLDRYLGARWQMNPVDHDVWQAINEVPDEELWRVHERRRQRLIVWARQRLRKQMQARGASAELIRQTLDALDPGALTIGFARRFATYKRGNLLLRDPRRLQRLLNDPQRPVQFIIAGKSHPADGGGKDLIRQIVQFARESEAGHRIVFLENYDIQVARYLVQGCDVWLNNPRRGMEASGTSGMKAAVNGCLNCSVMDGWWDEAFDPDVGWSIGRGEEYANPDTADQLESQALYDLFENEIVPTFYERDRLGIPRQWVSRMKKCIARLAPVFNTNRMVQEYAEKLYLPAIKRSQLLAADNLKGSVELAHQKYKLRDAWGKIKVESVESATEKSLNVRQPLAVSAVISLDGLAPQDVRVQVYSGRLDNDGRLVDCSANDLNHAEDLGNGRHRYSGQVLPTTSGRHGFAVRIVPGGELFDGMPEPGMILWEGAAPPVKKPRQSAEKAAVG